MSLQGRRGAILQEPSRLQRINNYFALPVSLSLDQDSSFKQLLDLGKGVVHSIGSKVMEILTPKVELSVQTRIVTTPEDLLPKPPKVEKPLNSLDLPVKRMPDSSPSTVKKRLVSRINAEVQTDLPYEPKPKGSIHRLDLIRSYEKPSKHSDPAAEVDTKGTDEDDEEFNFRKITKKRKIKFWIHRGPSLEIIPEKNDQKTELYRNSQSKNNDLLVFGTKNGYFSQNLKEENKNFFSAESQKNAGFSDFPPKNGKVIPESKAEDGIFGRKRTVFEGSSNNFNCFGVNGSGTAFGSESKTESFLKNEENFLDIPKIDTKKIEENFSLFSAFSSKSVNSESKNLNSLNDEKKGHETPGFDKKESELKASNCLSKPKIPLFVPASPPPAHFNRCRVPAENEGLSNEKGKSSESESKTLSNNELKINPFGISSFQKDDASSSAKIIETSGKTENKDLTSHSTESGSSCSQKIQSSDTLNKDIGTSASSSLSKPVDSGSLNLLNSSQSLSTVKSLDSMSNNLINAPLSSSTPANLPPRTVINNYLANPFLNASITSSPSISYRFGESKPDSSSIAPIPQSLPFTQSPNSTKMNIFNQGPELIPSNPVFPSQPSDFGDMEMDSTSNSTSNPTILNQIHIPQTMIQSSTPSFQSTFQPLNFQTNFVPSSTGIFGSQVIGSSPSVTGSTGFNLGVISGNQVKRGRK